MSGPQHLHASLMGDACPNILSTSLTGSQTTTAPSQLLLLHETRRCSRPLHHQPISAHETTASQKLRNSLLCDILHHLPTTKVSPHVWKLVDESDGEFPSRLVTKLRLSAMGGVAYELSWTFGDTRKKCVHPGSSSLSLPSHVFTSFIVVCFSFFHGPGGFLKIITRRYCWPDPPPE